MRRRSFRALPALLLALAAVPGCSSAEPTTATASPSATRTYLHPTRDLSIGQVDCDSGGEPYLTLWITNHSAHSMAYNIKYNLVDAHGKTVGTASGVFELSAHQVLGDTRLFGLTGRCGATARLAYVNAYDADALGADQPTF